MTERLVLVAPRARDLMWDALCNRACELPPLLEHEVTAQALAGAPSEDGVVRRDHRWSARPNVPAILAPHIDSEYLEWTCRTEWRPRDYRSRWTIEPAFLRESALCEVTMDFQPAIGGRGTRIAIALDLEALRAPAAVRTITARILATHFRMLVEAAARLVAQPALPREDPQ
ncbi:MAG TPA: hypothetical protein VLS49_04850 [Usitatibacter sp.]|nr:hypothetical protein [Usitatibacter sp.]